MGHAALNILVARSVMDQIHAFYRLAEMDLGRADRQACIFGVIASHNYSRACFEQEKNRVARRCLKAVRNAYFSIPFLLLAGPTEKQEPL